MNRLSILFAVLLGLCAQAFAQPKNRAQATLYTKVRGSEVYAAVVIRIDSDWYLYHTDLGHPDAIGAPTKFAFGGAPVTWGEVRMDAPKVKHVDDKYLGTYDYNYHTGRTTAYAKGELAPGADLAELALSISGQTCSDSAGTCVDYEETVRSSGEGADRYWEGWPEELGPAPGAAKAGGAGPEGTVQEGATRGDVGQPDPSQKVDPIGPPIPVDVGFDSRSRVTGKLYVRADEAAGTARAAVVLRVAPGYHVYHGPDAGDVGSAPGLPTVVTIEGGGVVWGETQYPAGERHPEVDGTWSHIHEGELRLLVDGLVSGAFDASGITASVEGLACDAKGCVPFEVTLEPLAGGDAAVFADLPVAEAGGAEGGADGGAGAVEPAGSEAGADAGGGALGTSQKSLLAYLGLAVLWGLITLLMPCTYPMIPITISYFTKQAMAREGKVLPLSLAYGGGIVLMFVVLGAALGKPVQYFANHPVTQLVIGGLFLFFALVLWGVINLQPPRALMQMAGKASRKGGMAGVFLMGLTLVVTSFSCTAPFVGDIIARGGALGWTRAILGMGVFGLTMAIPFVLLSLFPSRLQRMPSAGEWMHVLKVTLGFIEFAAAFKFFSGADLVWGLGMLPDELFLVIWLGTFLTLALFLFGRIRLVGETQHEIGPVRMAAGLATLIFSFYLVFGLLGFRMGPLMTAFLPGYRAERAAEWGGGGSGSAIREQIVIKDDLETALATAQAQNKLVLVNFTGFNCINCRQMEGSVFHDSEVEGELANYVEARLHVDRDGEPYEGQLALHERMNQTTSRPYYVVLDPSTRQPISRFPSATLAPTFAEFLRKARGG